MSDPRVIKIVAEYIVTREDGSEHTFHGGIEYPEGSPCSLRPVRHMFGSALAKVMCNEHMFWDMLDDQYRPGIKYGVEE